MSADVFAPLREAVEQLIASQGSADPKQHLAARRKLAANGPLLARLLREHAERGEALAAIRLAMYEDEEEHMVILKRLRSLSSSPHPTDNQT